MNESAKGTEAVGTYGRRRAVEVPAVDARERDVLPLQRREVRFAKEGLAAVLQDKDRPLEAKEMYREVLARYPGDAFALRGLGRTLASLGRYEEATEAFEKAADAAEGQKDRNAAKRALAVMRKRFLREGDAERARWVNSILNRLRASRTDSINGPA